MLKAKKGRLLISEPSLDDSIFFKSVVLLTHHDDDESIGLILNQKLDYISQNIYYHYYRQHILRRKGSQLAAMGMI